MASQQEAEIIFAQKLASNEKPIRSKALLKLRKYISVRSERETGGFSEVELLKIWKGLFYCQWMQDMPVLQEELSTKISALLHSFRTVDSQLLYFKTFLQTMKREWNGIDRLRMDKFYQLVRLVFREMFKMLRRQDWKSSLVNEFLELVSEQLLQSSSSAPPGLVLHILDLYMTELAVVGSDMLTAQQNLTLIEPFCKTLAKTKDRVLLKAIGSNIFNTIVDQVPYAIEDLLREIRESGSERDRMNRVDDDDDGQEEDSGVVQDDLSDTKDVKGHGECGPVLQFDYGAVADRLFQLASLTYIPSFNRSKVYKFVKIFRDLAEGVFPQDEMEEVSTDDEDEDDNRRRKKKRKRSKKQSQEKTDKEGEIGSETAPESDPSQDHKQEKKRKKKGSKSVEDADRPQNTQQRKNAKGLEVKEHLVSHHDSSDFRPDEKESESGADEETNISVLPPALQKKKKKKKTRKLKKTTTRDLHDEEKRDDVKQEENQTSHNTSAAEHTSREEEPSSDPSAITTPLKKRKRKKMKTRDVHDGQKTDDVKQENYSGDSNVTSAREEEPSSDPATPKKRKTKQTCSDQTQNNMTARKSERVRAVKSEAEESHEHTNTSEKKKKKKTLKSLELNGDTTEPKRRKRNVMNGHAESEKTPKTLSEKPDNKTAGFMFSVKKSPTALFCRSARMSRRRQVHSYTTPKSESKKVTFGLKNNQTMEFRKMDRSALVSPGGPSRVAFDPKKTPASGVLKSSTSSPALRRRFTAADFF